jgi:hypothetical protein
MPYSVPVYAMFGFAMLLYGSRRQREVEAAVVAGEFAWPERRLVAYPLCWQAASRLPPSS